MSKLILAQRAESSVLNYLPPKIDLGVPKEALQRYSDNQARGVDFKMGEVIRVTTGINQVESASIDDQVEARTLEKIQEVQEKAYQEAYQLGLDEGRKEAFTKTQESLNQKMAVVEQLIHSIQTMKTELFSQNERHLISLAYHMAERLACHELSISQEATLGILKQCIEMAQLEENLTVQVSPEFVAYLESVKNETGHEYEFLKKTKFEANPSLQKGGCIVSSNYGEIDARIEERLRKLWEGLEEALPRPKNLVSVA